MARKIISQVPITSAESKKILESNIDDVAKMNPKIQMLLQSLALTSKISSEKAIELKNKFVSEGVAERTATQLVDVLPTNDSELIAIAGSDTTLLSKKDKILNLIKEYLS
jgi:DNA-directed RNA polymerase subunit F